MNPSPHPIRTASANGHQSVRGPRASDGVGSALRQAYNPVNSLPPGMKKLLDLLP